MKIMEDHTQFSSDDPRHIWSISRAPDGPAAASIRACDGATQLMRASAPGKTEQVEDGRKHSIPPICRHIQTSA